MPYTIPSDGKNHQVGVQEQELTSSYKYYCTPKLDLDAFLFAQVTGWEGLNLLAGPAYIYFEGTYVGESLLDLAGVGDTLDISLGRDQGRHRAAHQAQGLQPAAGGGRQTRGERGLGDRRAQQQGTGHRPGDHRPISRWPSAARSR